MCCYGLLAPKSACHYQLHQVQQLTPESANLIRSYIPAGSMYLFEYTSEQRQISTSQETIPVPIDLRTFLLFILDLFFNNRKINFGGILLVQYHKMKINSKISGYVCLRLAKKNTPVLTLVLKESRRKEQYPTDSSALSC